MRAVHQKGCNQMVAINTLLVGTGAVYRRVSDDEQDIDRQRVETNKYLEQNGLTVAPQYVFEDAGWKRHQAAARPAFNRLLDAVDKGRIKWIIVDRQDRFEAGDKFEFISIVHRLRSSNCRLITADGRDVTASDIGAFFQTALSSEQSEGELREKAIRVVTAKDKRARAGEWQGGHVPYGMDVVCLSVPNLIEQWRVRIDGRNLRVKISPDGTEKEYNGKGNFPATETGQVLQLRPTLDTKRLVAVRRVFNTYASQSISFAAIAKDLNQTGVKANYGTAWECNTIQMMLSNPIYVGLASWNKNSQARYFQMVNGQRVQLDKRLSLKRHSSEWTLSQPLFEPIIDANTWQTVQDKLKSQIKNKRHRAPRCSDLWLSRLLYCAHCGKPMRAFPRTNGQNEYTCSTYSRSLERGTATGCTRNSVRHTVIEEMVRKYLADAGHQLSAANPAAIYQGYPDKAWELIERTYKAWRQVQERLGRAGQARMLLTHSQDDVMAVYQQLYSLDLPNSEARVKELNAEHDRLTTGILNIPRTAKLALKKAQDRIEEIEGQIASAQIDADNAAESYRQAATEYVAYQQEWAAAQQVVNSDLEGRRKAEAVSRVIERIELTFRPTERRQPVSELASITFLPKGDDGGNSDKMPQSWPMPHSKSLPQPSKKQQKGHQSAQNVPLQTSS